MKIAVITGASSGMGREFFNSLKDNKELDEIWVIARRMERLLELKNLTSIKVRAIPLDLSDPLSYDKYRELLDSNKPMIKYLICASGFGRFEAINDTKRSELTNMVDLNCNGVLAITRDSIDYMAKDSLMMVIASVAAFQPIPYIATYAATKAFVLSYCRALNRELKKIGSRCLAICPFWTKTEFFDRAKKDDSIVKKYVVMYNPKDIVKRAWRDSKHKNRDVSIYGAFTRAQSVLIKLLPHRLVMNIWMHQQRLK